MHFAIDCNKDSSFKLINNEMSTGEISIPSKQASPVRGVKYQRLFGIITSNIYSGQKRSPSTKAQSISTNTIVVRSTNLSPKH